MRRIILRTIPVKLYGPAGNICVLALYDEASTITRLDGKIAESLRLSGEKETLCLQRTNEEILTQRNSLRVDVNISKPDKDNKFDKKGVRTIGNLSLPVQNVYHYRLAEIFTFEKIVNY